MGVRSSLNTTPLGCNGTADSDSPEYSIYSGIYFNMSNK